MFLLPTTFIFIIWCTTAHHFATQPTNATRSVYQIFCDLSAFFSANTNLIKWVTIKMVGITVLFLVTIAPFCITFTHALITTPTNTFALDLAFPIFLMNGPLQPIIYILAFSKLRKAFLQLFCSAGKVTLDTTVVVDAPIGLAVLTMEMKKSTLKNVSEKMPVNPSSRGIV